MSRLGRNNSIRVALVVAALHLLGACPCGCLEHNGWYQAAMAALGVASTPPADTPCEGEKTCHDAMLLAARSADHGPDRGACATAIEAPGPVVLRQQQASVGGVIASRALRSRPSLAMLQVLRL